MVVLSDIFVTSLGALGKIEVAILPSQLDEIRKWSRTVLVQFNRSDNFGKLVTVARMVHQKDMKIWVRIGEVEDIELVAETIASLTVDLLILRQIGFTQLGTIARRIAKPVFLDTVVNAEVATLTHVDGLANNVKASKAKGMLVLPSMMTKIREKPAYASLELVVRTEGFRADTVGSFIKFGATKLIVPKGEDLSAMALQVGKYLAMHN